MRILSQALCFLAWEWINISLEYSVVSWVKMPRWLWAVVGVNLVTHPAFMLLLSLFGNKIPFVILCEVCIVFIEAALLCAIYGTRKWRFFALASLLMNGFSFSIGLIAL